VLNVIVLKCLIISIIFGRLHGWEVFIVFLQVSVHRSIPRSLFENMTLAGDPQLRSCGECAVRIALMTSRCCGTRESHQRVQKEGVKKDLDLKLND
jgi:hypothetical protein